MKLRTLCFVALLAGCGASTSDTPPAGAFVVDVEASLEAVRENPKYQEMSPNEREQSAEVLSRLAEQLRLDIDGKSFTWSQGEQLRSMEAQSVEQDGADWIYTFEQGEQRVTMRVAWEKGRLALDSSATDDLDYYRWKEASH